NVALEMLRRGMQHGRSAAHDARLVLITDGRGNVPLEMSRTGHITGAVGATGVQDAVRIASALGQLKHLESFVISPQLSLYADLPGTLAEALGAVDSRVVSRSEAAEGVA